MNKQIFNSEFKEAAISTAVFIVLLVVCLFLGW